MLDPKTSLPELRQELRLFKGPTTNKGEPCWLIYDPIRHRYFRLTQDIFQTLQHWDSGKVQNLKDDVERTHKRTLTDSEIAELIKFLHSNNLTETSASGDSKDYADQVNAARTTILKKTVHSYLFFRIPLVRPDKFLQATLPVVSFLYARSTHMFIAALSLIGLYLTSRQWETFKATFLDFMSFEGAIYYALSLVFVMTIHELGHAYTATRHGVRVNTMGIAFMVMMPLLYTDVTDAWRLKSRRKKLAIDAAGMGVELILAGLATLLWVFLPDGHMRSIAFTIATTSWILSLFVNLNPFMRFDGYYILTDAWGIPNLQPRAFAMAQWWLREVLFGLRLPAPEQFPPATKRALIAYAIGTWIYRLILFLGIALLVYHFFFKALGVILFLVEIIWFIALPIYREIMEWWSMRQDIVKTKRTLLTASVVTALLVLAFVPWNGTVAIQAVASAKTETKLFPPHAAYVSKVHVREDQKVEEGFVVAELASPDLEFEATQTQKEIALLEARRARIAGDRRDRLKLDIILSELDANRNKLLGLQRELDLLTLRAPFTGTIKDLDFDLTVGQWINQDTAIARLVAPGDIEARAYVDENNAWRLEKNDAATFIPEDPMVASRSARLVEISKVGANNLDLPYLASVYGGEVASELNADNEIVPRHGQYLVRLALEDSDWTRSLRGTIHLSGKPESFAAAAWRRILQVVVRESGV